MKTAEQLGISEEKRAAIEMVGRMLERGEIVHRPVMSYSQHLPEGRWFCMSYWRAGRKAEGCGTAACIGGWVEELTGLTFESGSVEGYGLCVENNVALDELFYPKAVDNYTNIRSEHAARAVRNYLDHGEARWEEVLA